MKVKSLLVASMVFSFLVVSAVMAEVYAPMEVQPLGLFRR